MKRVGNLYDRICDPDNLRDAFLKARRGKALRLDARAFADRIDENLAELREQLVSRAWNIGNYRYFTVFDPKERTICAAPFQERVLHHAVVNVCEPHFEKWQLDASHACRKGRGLDSALAAAQRHARRHAWYLKLDVRKYFGSIPHDRLLARLGRRFKDPDLLDLFAALLDTYEVPRGEDPGGENSPGEPLRLGGDASPHPSPRGLPIGNLTSQFFANFYLEPLDRFVKETLRVSGYVRYMDDFVLWGKSKETLCAQELDVRSFCLDRLGLELKPSAMNRTNAGMPFLGYVLRPSGIRLSLRAKRRFSAGIRAANAAEDPIRALPLLAFVGRARSTAFRRKILYGASDNGVNRVNRGGSWNNNARNCRSANRDRNEPGYRNNNLGFRVALAPAQGQGGCRS